MRRDQSFKGRQFTAEVILWAVRWYPMFPMVLSQILGRWGLVYDRQRRTSRERQVAIEFKGSHFERDVILWGVRWYVAYPISYRQLEEMMEERGVEVDHSTLNRWVLKYAPLLEREFRARKIALPAQGVRSSMVHLTRSQSTKAGRTRRRSKATARNIRRVLRFVRSTTSITLLTRTIAPSNG